MSKYEVYENGKKLTMTDDWEKTVIGLNTAQDMIDADYQEITIKKRGKIVFHQPKTRVP